MAISSVIGLQEIVVVTELRWLEVLQEVSLGRLKPISAIGLTLPLPSQLLRSCKEIIVSTGSALGNIVLVHGAFVDGSPGGQFTTFSPQTAITSPWCRIRPVIAGRRGTTRLIIDAQDGPVVLVGHSYGGAVITEAGTMDKVTALVYIPRLFAPDEGESVGKRWRRPRCAGVAHRPRAWRVLIPRPAGRLTLRCVLTCPPQTPRS